VHLKIHRRKKDGKEHRYFSIVESRRVSRAKVVHRTVLYLGEINDSQPSAWRKTLEVLDEDRRGLASLSLFPEDRELPADAVDGVPVKLSEMRVERPRTFGSCWLGGALWRQLKLDEFWQARLPEGRRLVMPRYTQPTPKQKLLLHELQLMLPAQPPPRITVQPEIFPAGMLRL
jgi:hypothetical protein